MAGYIAQSDPDMEDQLAGAGPLTIGAHQSSPKLAWEILRGDQSLIDDLEDEWNALCDSGQVRYPYLRPAVIRAYLDAFASGASLVILTGRHEGRLIALLPLVSRSVGVGPFRLRLLRSAGNIYFPQLDVISCHEDPDQIAREIWDMLRASGDWDIVQIDSAPADGIANRIRELATQDGHKSRFYHPEEAPYITIPDEETLATMLTGERKGLRKQLRRDLRRLEEMGELRLVETGKDGDREALATAYRQFVEMEDRSWKGENGSSVITKPRLDAYHKRLIADPKVKDAFRVHLLTCNGDPIAASLNMVSGTTLFGLCIAFNNDYRPYSPGRLLLLHELASLRRQGFDIHDLGAGLFEYKTYWTSTTTTLGYPFIFSKGLRGHLAHDAMFRLWPRLEPILESKWLRLVANRLRDARA